MDQRPISVLLIEDDPLWLQSIQSNLEDFGFSISGTATTFESAIVALSSVSFDIALVDISIHGRESGIELGTLLNTVYKKPYIFITGNAGRDTVNLAMGSRPSGYLLKPIVPVALFAAIHSAVQNFQEGTSPAEITSASDNQESFFVRVGDRFKKVYWSDIVYLGSDKNYTSLFSASDKSFYYIRSTLMKTLRFMVPQHLKNRFIQINRAEAVNLDFVKELMGDEVVTAFKTLSVSETYSKELRNRLNIIA